jgi:N-acetylglucosaminyl-diphospho-decaprenol L-rhamnosyltransferase
MSPKDLSIIIVNWNGGEMILRCLRSIRTTRNSFAVRVIVIDNNSSDGSREAAQKEFPEFEIINSGSNLGFGRANNLARTMVTTPLVLFLNPDTELFERSLEDSVNCLMEHPDVGALGCKMRYLDGTIQEQGLQWFPSPLTILAEMTVAPLMRKTPLAGLLPKFDPNHSCYARKLYGGFVLARKDVLDKAGWFDDRYFMYAEDVDLSRTVLDLGWKLYYTADAEIIHIAGGTSAKAPSGFAILMKSESINKLIRKYQGGLGAFAHRVVLFVASLLRMALLLPVRLLFLVAPSEQRLAAWRGSIFKLQLIILWSLGMRKAVVATSRKPAAEGH